MSMEDSCARECLSSILFYFSTCKYVQYLIQPHIISMIKEGKENLLIFLTKHKFLGLQDITVCNTYSSHGSREFVLYICDMFKRNLDAPAKYAWLNAARNKHDVLSIMKSKFPDSKNIADAAYIMRRWYIQGITCEADVLTLREMSEKYVISSFIELESGKSRTARYLSKFSIILSANWMQACGYNETRIPDEEFMEYIYMHRVDALRKYIIKHDDTYIGWKKLLILAVNKKRYDIIRESIEMLIKKADEPHRRDVVYGVNEKTWNIFKDYILEDRISDVIRDVIVCVCNSQDKILSARLLKNLPTKWKEDELLKFLM